MANDALRKPLEYGKIVNENTILDAMYGDTDTVWRTQYKHITKPGKNKANCHPN